jgi:3-phenylpropionate/cinnamic acid dioxygenase small subunit
MKLEEIADRISITDVITRYARSVDRQDFDLARTCYHPDAFDDHGRYKGDVNGLIDFFRTLGATLRVTTHQMGTPHIELVGGTAWVETYCMFRRDSYHASPQDAVLQGLRYLDRFEKRHGQWAIAYRQVVLDWEQSGALAPTPPSSATWSRGDHGEHDPSFEFLRAAKAARDEP